MKRWPATMHLELVAAHLNVPVGQLLMPQDVAIALRTGSLGAVSEPAASILSYIFVETKPQTILACVSEAEASLQSAQRLYEQTLTVGIQPVAEWEEFVKDLL